MIRLKKLQTDWIIGVGTLCILLFYRFIESVTRAYAPPDEFSQLHSVYLLSQGLVPFRDFFNIYPPIFLATLVPVFRIAGEQFVALTGSRIVVFVYQLAGWWATYAITRLFAGRRTAFLAVFIAVSLPMSIEKTLEVRPDNLMMPLALWGTYFFLKGIENIYAKANNREHEAGDTRSGSPKNFPRNFLGLASGRTRFLLSGILFALSFWTLPKIIFTLLGFFLGVAVLVSVDTDVLRAVKKGMLPFLAGGLLVSVVYWGTFASFGIAGSAFHSMFVQSRVTVSGLRFGVELHPLYWFAPVDSVYGGYKNVSWYYNFFLFALALIGFTAPVLSFTRKKHARFLAPLLGATFLSFFSLYTIPRPYLQYLIPWLAFVPIWAAVGYERITKLRIRNTEFRIPYSILFLLLCVWSVWSMWDAWTVKRYWTDEDNRKFINHVLTTTKKDDLFWGEDGIYVFRKDGYRSFYDFEAMLKVEPTVDKIVAGLEANKTAYILVNTKALQERSWPYDNVALNPFRDWVFTNYEETAYPGMWKRK